jgi:signal transduction histidine kinase/ActR/RegA family two-component response regulator
VDFGLSDLIRSQFFLPLVVLSVLLAVLALALIVALRKLAVVRRRQREADLEIQQLEGRLDQAHRMEAVGILAGSIVNNLNNLLAVILGHTRIASNELGLEAPARQELDRIAKAGHMASELVREISDFYLQADRARKPTNLVPVVRDTLKLIRDILPSTIIIKSELKPCSPVLASVTGIQQVLMNLCSNSMNAMYRQTGTLEITLEEEVVAGARTAYPQDLAPGSYARLTVRDDGRGMDRQTLDHIFDSYFTSDREGTQLGIGLSTVSRILQDNGGVTIVHSQVGEGTSFDLYFPLIAWEVAAPDNLKSLAAVAGSGEADAADRNQGESFAGKVIGGEPETDKPKATVLLIDDEEMVAQVMTSGLERQGFRVITHTDSRKALADFSQTPELFDVVVTDQIMPHMSGVRLTRKIHEMRPDLPVILFTGFRDSFHEAQAREAGVVEFLLKPGSHRDLANLILRLTKRKLEGRG